MAAVTVRAAPLADPQCDPSPFVRRDGRGIARLELAVKGAHCANCLARIERGLRQLSGVEDARLNLSTGKLTVSWLEDRLAAAAIIRRVEDLGFAARPYDPRALIDNEAEEGRFLLRCLAVAGFASANVMLLSISVWSGLGGEMGEGTRTLFHLISGLIAIPAALYAGRPFFRSALKSLSKRRANMDVPISLAILLALVLSVYQTALHGRQAYFDAAVMLPFLLLIGRCLDFQLRQKARGAARELVAMQAVTARRIEGDAGMRPVPAADIAPGDRLLIATGERVPVDGVLEERGTEADLSLVSGESAPVRLERGALVHAGSVITGRAVVLCARNRVEDSFVAELARLVEAGQQQRNRYVRLADRAAAIYVPTVHTLAASVFLFWLLVLQAGVAASLKSAISLLIITCPCALGLAVPAVQIVATGLLFRRGVLVKSGDALERLAEIDRAIFDKTGTMTLGAPTLINAAELGPETLEQAARLARASRHPLARAIAEAAGTGAVASDAEEVPGSGIQSRESGQLVRLGRADWVCGNVGAATGLWFRRGDERPVLFAFADRVRSDARAVVSELARRHVPATLLSGDRATVAAGVARDVGITDWQAEITPAGKMASIEAARDAGHRVLMVGDGLNDSAALAAAHVSIAPASALDAAQAAADMVVTGEALMPIVAAVDVARQARRRVLENFWFAAAYNAVAIPLAALGLVTPLIAAVAMASSSLVVTLNALRLRAPA